MTYCLVIITAPLDRSAKIWTSGLWLISLPVAVALVSSAWLGMNFDIRYAFGGLRAAPGTVFDTFVHRPLAYRLLVWLLDLGPRVVTPDAPAGAVAEALIRGEALLLVTAVCVLIWAGIRRHRPGRPAVFVAVGLWCAFALAANWSFLEPDWVGALWASAAMGAALLPRRASLAAAVAGVLVLLCVATKLSTAPYAVIAGGVVWFLDRKRAYLAAAWSVGSVLVWLAGTWKFDPLEWQWLRDMSALVPDSALKVGFVGIDWWAFGQSALDVLVVSPVVLVIPAATVVLARLSCRPVAVVCAVAGAVVLAAASVAVQGEWYLYQWAVLPVFAAGLGAAMLAARPTLTNVVAVLIPAVAGGAFSMVALTRPLAWRSTHLPQVAVALALTAGLGVVFACLRPSANSSVRGMAALATVAAVVSFGAANLPTAAYGMTMSHAQDTNLSRYRATADLRWQFAELRQRIGPETTVLYLAFGDINYLLGNPTDCRYPSPVWLQRSTFLPYVRDFASYRDNVSCLDTTARYLLIDRSWFTLSALDLALVTRINDMFDCDHAIRIRDTIDVCPHRP